MVSVGEAGEVNTGNPIGGEPPEINPYNLDPQLRSSCVALNIADLSRHGD